MIKKQPVPKPVATTVKESPSNTFLTSTDPQASATKKEAASPQSSARPVETESNKQPQISEKVIEEEDFEEYALGTMNNSAQREKQGLGEDIDVVTDQGQDEPIEEQNPETAPTHQRAQLQSEQGSESSAGGLQPSFSKAILHNNSQAHLEVVDETEVEIEQKITGEHESYQSA